MAWGQTWLIFKVRPGFQVINDFLLTKPADSPGLCFVIGSLSLAITHPQFYWYVDESLSPECLSSSLLRSEIHFGAPLPSYYSLQDRADEQRAHFKNFVVHYADMLAKQSTRSDATSSLSLSLIHSGVSLYFLLVHCQKGF